jgi:predicted house-cleaning noncanonical NTP pyrophosphatase (MazG superfamily)
MKKVYKKLVRDKIPEIIQAKGEKCEVRFLNDYEYKIEVLKKLSEEVAEVLQAENNEELIKEIGDVQEVLRGLAAAYNLDIAEIDRVREQRRKERGGFDKKTFLEYTE